MSRARMRAAHALTAAVVLVGLVVVEVPSGAETSGSISGVAYQDTNRNGVLDDGEAPWEGHVIYLLSGDRAEFITKARTDAAGHYRIDSVPSGQYSLELATTSWRTLRDDWVPTTSGSLRPRIALQLAAPSEAHADFGWRPILRSSEPSSPISEVTGPSGVRVQSFNDVVSASDLHDALQAGGLFGPELALTKIRFDLEPTSSCATSTVRSGDAYAGFSATCNIGWSSWLLNGDRPLFHEYGHAWSLYHAYIVQQDPELTAYLVARGLLGDERLESSHAWSRREMIAEDYRQLFGSPSAQAAPQENRDVPAATAVPGLREFLAGPFMEGANLVEDPSIEAAPDTSGTIEALSVTSVSVNPSPVKQSGEVHFALTTAASVVVEIRSPLGAMIKSVTTGATFDGGPSAVVWDRTDGSGKRVRRGTYVALVMATNAAGLTDMESAAFEVG